VKLRARANGGGGYEACVSDAVGAFDTVAGQYAKQLLARIPLRPARKARIERMRFHNVGTSATEFKTAFDIDILEGMKPDDVTFTTDVSSPARLRTQRPDRAKRGRALHLRSPWSARGVKGPSGK
jgi:hypothetical protein